MGTVAAKEQVTAPASPFASHTATLLEVDDAGAAME